MADKSGNVLQHRWKHRNRGTTYQMRGAATLQTETPLSDMAELIVYQSEKDGQLWARPVDEFLDGRFEDLGLADVPQGVVLETALEPDANVVIVAQKGCDMSDESPKEVSLRRQANLMSVALWTELCQKAGPGVLPEQLPGPAANVLRGMFYDHLVQAET